MYIPYRNKIIETIPVVSQRERRAALRKAGYNPFNLPADRVIIDLISDSGTGAMSTAQWSTMLQAQEDFSGQKAYRDFSHAARRLFLKHYVQPVHQGRAAENILFSCLLRPGDIVLANTLFETTRDNIETKGARAIDLPKPEKKFLGNIDIRKLSAHLRNEKRVRMIVLTITSNIQGGQPVSLEAMRRTYRIARQYDIPVVFDASRFADNAYLIKDYTGTKRSIPAICTRMFTYADIIYLSCKKSGLVNIGGCIAMDNRKLFRKVREAVISQESFPTSGGLAARDLSAISIGLHESIDEAMLASHVSLVRFLGTSLKQQGVSIHEPIGGHGVVVRPYRSKMYAAFSLAASVYLHSGIRGGVFNGMYRLAPPRRVYTQDHMTFVSQAVVAVYKKPMSGLTPYHIPCKFTDFFIRFKKN